MNTARAMIISLFFSFIFAIALFDITPAQTVQKSNIQPLPAVSEHQENTGNTAAQINNLETDCTKIEPGAIILVADTSPSVKNQLNEIKLRGKEILAIAPPCTRFGIVSINWEAIKKTFADKTEAENFLDSLTVGGKYTDLNRGIDAALSLLPSSGKSVVVFMTDGKATVPATFKNKESFIEVLRREYSARPEVKVFVLNVKGEPLAKGETLPPNVTIIPISDWQAARSVIAETLAPQIKQQLAAPPTPNNPTRTEESNQPEKTAVFNKNLILISGAIIAVAALVGLFIFLRVRRNRLRKQEENLLSEQPENILRDEDLQKPVAEETVPEAVLMIEAINVKNENGHFAISPQRSFLHIKERLTIGGSRLLAGMYLESLNQSQTLEISFDGKIAGVVRLRPDAGESLDAVILNGQNAPKCFLLNPNEPNQLLVGAYELKFTLADESVIELFDTSQRTRPSMLGSNPVVTGTEQRLPRRRLRS